MPIKAIAFDVTGPFSISGALMDAAKRCSVLRPFELSRDLRGQRRSTSGSAAIRAVCPTEIRPRPGNGGLAANTRSCDLQSQF